MPAETEDQAPTSPGHGALELAAILVGAVLAAIGLLVLARGEQVNPEDLALGVETTAFYATREGQPIHCGSVDEAGPCLAGHQARGGRPVVLWLGNSQLHAINQMRPGDETAPAMLHDSLRVDGLDVVAFSLPNANLQEQLVLFAYLADRLPIEWLLLPFVFDDFREGEVRGVVSEPLSEPGVVEILERSDVGRSILANNRQQAAGDLAALEGTVQQRTEARLNAWLEENWELWAGRPDARSALFSQLYLLRNSVFGITAQSKRRAIPGRLQRNFEAAAALMQEARRREIGVLAYIVPLRQDVDAPYIRSEYLAFGEDVERVAREGGAAFLNFEALVPGQLWGSKDATSLDGTAELDFMHFQVGGHALLASAVESEIRQALAR